jgi:hypothetical protein
MAAITLASRTFGEPPAGSAGKPTENKATAGPATAAPTAPAKGQVGPPVPTPAAPAGPTPTVTLKPGEEPKVEFDTPIYDFGKMKTGKDIEHDFWFHNTGTGPLEIVQVKPSCGCTTTSQYDKVVQPGQSGKIPIKVSTGRATGPTNKSITVITNVSGAGSTVALQVRGELWESIQATPNSALFGNVPASQGKEVPLVRKLTVANNTETPVKLGDIRHSHPAFAGELKEIVPGKQWELMVTLKMPQPTGVLSATLELDTGISDPPKLTIPCSAYLVADVDVVPNKMVLPASRTANLQRDFYIRNNSSKPIQLSELSGSNPMLKLGMQETQPGMSFRLSMDVPPDYKVPKDGDTITFKTNHPGYPTISIPITEAASAPIVRAPTPAAAAGTATAAKPGASPVAAGVVPAASAAKASK